MPEHQPFKTCPVCGCQWPTRKDFFSDPSVRYIGIQKNEDPLSLFNHTCHGTIAIRGTRETGTGRSVVRQNQTDRRA